MKEAKDGDIGVKWAAVKVTNMKDLEKKLPNPISGGVEIMPLIEEEGSEVAKAAEDDGVEVEIKKLDGIEAIELDAAKNVGSGEVVEATDGGGGLEKGWQLGGKGLFF